MADETRASDHLLWALQERAKELSCLYQIEDLLNRSETPLDEVLAGVIRAIPPGWQYPADCQARIDYEGRATRSEGFVETPWRQQADIVVQDRVVGRVTVSYRSEKPSADEGPFLREEGKLLGTIADRLAHFILHQKLRDVFEEWRHARESFSVSGGTPEWRSALNLLRRTDQDLYLGISRKMANHLSWSGLPEAQALLSSFGEPRELDAELIGEQNQPSAMLPFDSSLDLAERVFDLAAVTLSDAEILERIQKWVADDRSSFLVKTVVNVESSPIEIADAIRRYQHVVPAGTRMSQATDSAVRVNLIRRFLSDDLEYLKVARQVIGVDDMLLLLERLIAMPGSPGRLGGKCAGVFLGHAILRQSAAEAGVPGSVKTPRTWFIASDTSLRFIGYNNLEEVYEQKYKDLDQVRLEYPHLVRLFKSSHFPPEVVKGLSVALDDLGESPLVVRSSSLLEDRLGTAFSGKYKSLFVANQGTKPERLKALLDAVAEVYASIFSPDPIQYRVERGLLDFREEMGIMIQEVVGTRVGHSFLPAWAGVAFSTNELRWSPRIRRDDGLIRLVPGLGTRAVDRVSDDYPILIAPGQPSLRVNVTTDEIVRYSPQRIDLIDLTTRALQTVDARTLLAEAGGEYPAVQRVVSLHEGGSITRKPLLLLDFQHDDLVVTFEGLVSDTPFVAEMGAILKTLQQRLGHPVDIEFASDGTDLYLLQCRPQSRGKEMQPSPIPKDVPKERVVFSANRFVSNGRVPDITHIVYVDPERYAALPDVADAQAVGRAVSRLNKVLPKRQFILIGPGRWGSRGDIKLGVNVTYSDINNTAMLVEVARARGGYLPDLSFGTHFFQDLVEASIRYLPLYPDDGTVAFNERFLLDSENALPDLVPEHKGLAGVVRVIDVPRTTGGQVLRVLQNADLDEALAFLAPPQTTSEPGAGLAEKTDRGLEDCWRWRLRMAEKLAAQLDLEAFGVRALYLIGSSKNATAGPASDIDLLVHVRGTEAQRRELEMWLEGWSLCLAEMNFLRTGYKTPGLLDVHFVTDADIAARSSFAVKIGAATDPARPLAVAPPA